MKMRQIRQHSLLIVMGGGKILCLTAICFWQWGKKISYANHNIQRQLCELQIENGLLYELYARQPQHLHIKDSVLNVLCLGNSITLHPVREEVEWFSNWGMAASCPEKDYCHVLESLLKNRNASSVVTPMNIAYWEQNLSCDIDSLIGDWCMDKNLIVIRLGENVCDTELFEARLLSLVKYCEKYTPNIIVTGNFWRSPIKEKALMSVAHTTGHPFVPLVWIAENNAVYPQIGDTLIDIHNDPYTIDHDFIITHPNDEGMRMIAEEIYKILD